MSLLRATLTRLESTLPRPDPGKVDSSPWRA